MRKVSLFTMVLVLTMVFSMNVHAAKVKLLWITCCAQADRAVLFKQIAQEYMDTHPDVEVQWMYPAGNYTNNLKTYFAAGSGPDVFWIGGDIWAFIDMVRPLNDLVKNDAGAKAINPVVLKLSEFQGKQLGLPFGANVNTMLYNKDHFGRAGIAPPAANWTYDDMLRMARQLTIDTNGDRSPDQWGVQFLNILHWALTAGGDVYTPDQRKVRIANPVTIDFTQLAADIYSGVSGLSFAPANASACAKGKVSMQNIGIFNLPEYREVPFDWDIQKMPVSAHDGQRYENTFNTLENWAISNQTTHPDIARDFVSFLLSRDVMLQVTTSGIVMPTQNIMAARFVQAPAPPANLSAFIDGLSYGHQIILTHPYGSALRTWLDTQQTWKDMWASKIPARVALPELQDKMNMMLDEYWSNRG